MTHEECLAAFAAAEMPSAALLAAALPLADALAADITVLLARAAADEPLLIAEERQAACGLAVLAATRRTVVFPVLARMVADSIAMWPRVLATDAETVLPAYITALHDGGATPLDAVYDRMVQEATPPDLRASLFLAFAWLAAAGRTPPDPLADALEHFAQTSEPDDPAWSGWFPAARALGLDTEVARQHRRQLDAIAEEPIKEEAAAWREMLERANAPDALAAAAPLDNPAGAFPPPAPSAAEVLPGLSASEEAWLDWQLLTLSATGAAMPLESVDGYFTALHICPDAPPLAGNTAPIWAGATAQERFSRPVVAEAAEALLDRWFAAARDCFARGIAMPPYLEIDDPDLSEGALWGMGFVAGLEQMDASWRLLLTRPAVENLVRPILLLAEAAEPLDDDASDEEETARFVRCGEILDELPDAMQSLWQLVRKTAVRPDRSVGRNDPCPCGSGRKFKKCCGAPGAVRRF
jgi:uncharacterized protein